MNDFPTTSSSRSARRRIVSVALAIPWLFAALVSDPEISIGARPQIDEMEERQGEHQQLDVDFSQLEGDVSERGIDAVLTEMNARSREGGDRRLVAALDHLRAVLREHPDQLWFQLHSHTRLMGWEDIQEQLAASRPAEMLVARTSLLPAPLPGVLRTWSFGERAVSHLRMSTDAKELYCGASTLEFIVIDPRAATIVRRMPVNGSVLATLPGPNGRDYFVTGERGAMIVRDTLTGIAIATLKDTVRFDHQTSGVWQTGPPMQTSPDGEHIVFWYGPAFIDRELANLKNAHRFRSRTEPTSVTAVFIEFLDTARLLSVDTGGYVRIFAYPDGKELYPPRRIVKRVAAVAISPDCSRIACGGIVPLGPPQEMRPGTIRQNFEEVVLVWDVTTRKEVTRFRPPPVEQGSRGYRTTALAFQDNDTLVTGGPAGKVRQWRIGEPEAIATVAAHYKPVLSVVPTSDEERVYTADRYGHVKLVDLASRDALPEPLPTGDVRSFRNVASWDGRWEASTSRGIVDIWDAESDQPLHHLVIPQALARGIGNVRSVGIDLEQKRLILGGEERIALWDFDSGETQRIDVDVSQIRFGTRGGPSRLPVYVSPDGRHAVAWQSQKLAVFDPESGEQKFMLSPGCYFGGVHHFLDGGQMAVTFRDSPHFGVRVFDLDRGKEIAVHTHGFFQYGVAYADHAGVIVTGGKRGHSSVSEPNTIAIWKPGATAEFVDLPEGVGVSKIGVTRDASRAVTVSHDGVLLLWDLARQEVLRRFDLGLRIHSLAFDGRTLVVTEHDKTTQHIFEYIENRASH